MFFQIKNRLSLIPLFFLLGIFQLYPFHKQTQEDRTISYIKNELLYKENGLIITELDSIYNNNNGYVKYFSLLLKGRIESQSGDVESFYRALIETERYALLNNDNLLLATLYNILAREYHLVGFKKEQDKYVELTLEYVDKLPKDDNNRIIIEHGILLTKAASFTKEKKYNEAINVYEKTLKVANRIKDDNLRILGLSEVYYSIADTYLKLKNYDKTKYNLDKALSVIETLKDSYVYKKNLICYADLMLQTNDYEQSLKYLQLINESEENDPTLKTKLYTIYENLYTKLNNIEKAYEYSEKLKKLNSEIIEVRLVGIDGFQKYKIEDEVKFHNGLRLQKIRTIVLIGFLLCIIVFFIVVIYRKREYFFKKSFQDKSLEKNLEKLETSTSQILLNDKTKENIQVKLKEFETSNLYLKKNYLLSNLSSDINTNYKYINIVLKDVYDTDFNTYINNLKIKYILDLWNNDEESRKYKLSYVASLSGFSSHSKFSNVFKNYTGVSPSEYLKTNF